MTEGYRGSTEPNPAMKTVHPAGVISLMKESRIEADLRIAKSLSAESGKSLPPAWEHIEVLVRHRSPESTEAYSTLSREVVRKSLESLSARLRVSPKEEWNGGATNAQ